MNYSKHAPRCLVDMHMTLMSQMDESPASKALFDKIMGPALNKIMVAARRAKLEKWGNSLERQEQIDWFKRPTPIDAFVDGVPGNDLLILGVLVREDIEWMCPIWEILREKEDDFDDAGRRLYSASVSVYKKAGSDKADLRRVIEEQASSLPPAGDEYLAGEVHLSFERDESIRPHTEPTRAELELLLKHSDSDLSEAAWESLVAYQRKVYEDTTSKTPLSQEEAKRRELPPLTRSMATLSRAAVTMQEREKAEEQKQQAKKEKKGVETKLNAEKKGRRQDKIIANREQRETEQIAEEAEGRAQQAEKDALPIKKGRIKGTKTTTLNAEKKDKKWIAEYKKEKRKNPRLKKCVLFDEVALKLNGTPYKGSAPYMQERLKGRV